MGKTHQPCEPTGQGTLAHGAMLWVPHACKTDIVAGINKCPAAILTQSRITNVPPLTALQHRDSAATGCRRHNKTIRNVDDLGQKLTKR